MRPYARRLPRLRRLVASRAAARPRVNPCVRQRLRRPACPPPSATPPASRQTPARHPMRSPSPPPALPPARRLPRRRRPTRHPMCPPAKPSPARLRPTAAICGSWAHSRHSRLRPGTPPTDPTSSHVSAQAPSRSCRSGRRPEPGPARVRSRAGPGAKPGSQGLPGAARHRSPPLSRPPTGEARAYR